MSVVNVNLVTAIDDPHPKYIEVTLANGQVIRYRPEGVLR